MESKYSPIQIQAATAKVLNLFAELKEEFGDLFEYKKHRYTPVKAKEWAIELLEAGINAEQFKHGCYMAKKREDYPVERSHIFIKLCKQVGTTNYPTANSAFMTACQNCGMKGDIERDWKHEVVYETANRIGWGTLASATEYFFKHFERVYQEVIAEHESGATFVIPNSHRVEYEHSAVKPGSEADKKISEQLAKIMRVKA